MSTKTCRRLELRGRNNLELLFRVDRFQQALQARQGELVGVDWNRGSLRFTPSATVFYRVPLSTRDQAGPASAG